MPDLGEHLAQARHNEDLVAHLNDDSPNYVDWQITVLFYAALHYVDAYFAAGASAVVPVRPLLTNPHPRNHAERDQLVSRHLGPVHNAYRLLKDLSIDARYQIGGFTPREVTEARNVLLATIRQEIQQRLSMPL